MRLSNRKEGEKIAAFFKTCLNFASILFAVYLFLPLKADWPYFLL
jgi:hypothetical protein